MAEITEMRERLERERMLKVGAVRNVSLERTSVVKSAEYYHKVNDNLGNIIKLALKPTLYFSAFGEIVNPLEEFGGYSKVDKMIKRMGLADEKVTEQKLAWMEVKIEPIGTEKRCYTALYCFPKEANFVLIRQLVKPTRPFQLPKDFLGRDFTVIIEDFNYGEALTERYILAPLDFYVAYEEVDAWRKEAQDEFNVWQGNVEESSVYNLHSLKDRIEICRALRHLQERLYDLDWDWAQDLEEIRVTDEKGRHEVVRLSKGWQKSLRFSYIQPAREDNVFLWLGQRYEYCQEELETLERSVVAIESARTEVRGRQIIQEKYLALVEEMGVSYEMLNASGACVASHNSYTKFRCGDLFATFYPMKVSLKRISTGANLGEFRYRGKEGEDADVAYELFATLLVREKAELWSAGKLKTVALNKFKLMSQRVKV